MLQKYNTNFFLVDKCSFLVYNGLLNENLEVI